MKLSWNEPRIGQLNVFSLITVSLVWGMMLGMISPWWITLTVLTAMIGYGSEIKPGKQDDQKITLN